MKKLNIVFGAVLMGIAAFFFLHAGSFKALSGQKDVGPGAFPRFVCGALILCGALLIAREARRGSEEKISLFNRNFFAGILAIFCYFLLLRPLGFLIDSIWIVGVMMLILLNEPLKKAWPIVAAVSVLVPIVLYIIFAVFLKVPLPGGVLTLLMG